MARIAIIGGHGKIGRLLGGLLVAGGHQPVAVVRRLEQAEHLRELGIEVALLDLERSTPGDLSPILTSADAVVFTAGAGPDGLVRRKQSVDLGGSLLAQQAAQLSGVRRFVQVSALAVDEPVPEDASEVWRAYVIAKRDADAALRESGLQWTIIRPGRLTDEPGNGHISLAPRLERGEVPRADVAAVIAAVLEEPATIGRQWDLVEGDDDVAAAVSRALASSDTGAS